jgi:hypothetical protein
MVRSSRRGNGAAASVTEPIDRADDRTAADVSRERALLVGAGAAIGLLTG